MNETSHAVEITRCRLDLGRGGERKLRFMLDALSVARGEQIALIGPSGCGKSTLLNLTAGLQRCDEGEIRINGQDITALSAAGMDAFRGKNIGIVFQGYNLLEPFSALENVLIGMRFGRSSQVGNRKARAEELLVKVGLKERLHARPSRMSAGERQRVAIARGIANNPTLLLADEPTGALDPETGRQVFSLIRSICSEAGCALMFVTHDPLLASEFSRSVNCLGLVQNASTEVAA